MRLPAWLKQKRPALGKSIAVNNILKRRNLHTVCQSAKCPNIFECFAKGAATFLILGDACTRHCRFCSVWKPARPDVTSGQSGWETPKPPSPDEPKNVADACRKMKLKHIVITSVTRDDLPDNGAGVFYDTIIEVRQVCPEVTIEVLTPDFQGSEVDIRKVIFAKPDIFNHNIETVPRLYDAIRPGADYHRSLRLLSFIKEVDTGIITKSGLMLGLGEEPDEVAETLKDLRKADCDMVTIGQYLRPSSDAGIAEVKRFVPPEEFKSYRAQALEMGFKSVASGPFVRSSYMAEELLVVQTK
ncbi:MAG: lipoyl synthase [Planctomycetota bacterium]